MLARPLLAILLLFVAVPLLELALLLGLARLTSPWVTLGTVLVTGVVGGWLARREGLRTLARFRADTAAGRLPADPLLDGAMVLVAGAFLLTPGILTDAAGFALLIPGVRRAVRSGLKGYLAHRVSVRVLGPGATAPRPRGDVLEPEYRRTDVERVGDVRDAP